MIAVCAPVEMGCIEQQIGITDLIRVEKTPAWIDLGVDIGNPSVLRCLPHLRVYICQCKIYGDTDKGPISIGVAQWADCRFGDDQIIFAVCPTADREEMNAAARENMKGVSTTWEFVIATTSEKALANLAILAALVRE